MATEVEYALMAGRVYQSTRATINWLPDLQSLGWTEFFLQQQSSGYEAVSFQKGNEIVISFAGTGSNVDWWANAGGFFGVTTEQLRQAADYYLTVKATNSGAIINLTGHSLGGGLASLMAVFFDETAVTFDQAPFRNSASVSVATSLKEYLLNERGYSEAALQELTNFISAAAGGGIPHNYNVIDFSVQGEILSSASGLRIGTPTSWTHGAPDLGSIDLHSHALLITFLQSDRTAPAQQSLSDVTLKLPDVLRMIFDSNLYAFSTGTQNTQNENFIERLVRHQNGIAGFAVGETVIPADAMLTRFTSDLWKLAQDGGLTMTDGPTPATNLVSKALIAFAMQKYYTETQASTGYNREFFAELDAGSSGGIRFDLADVTSAPLNTTKGDNLYFHNYVANSFSPSDRDRVYASLQGLRDWYVQAGPGGMNATDIHNRGAFMLGGTGGDTLTGGSQSDLLVGNVGADRLSGGGGNDTLLGGVGFDTYYYNTGDGNDRIEDSDARGVIFVNGQMLVGGVKKAGHTDWTSLDGTITYQMSGTDLIVELDGETIMTVNENFESGQFGIRLIDEPATPSYENTWDTRRYYVETGFEPDGPTTDPSLNLILYGSESVNNVLEHGSMLGNDQVYGYGGGDTIEAGLGHDRVYGGGGTDLIYGGKRGWTENVDTLDGDDYLDGEMGNDHLVGLAGNDRLFGGEGNDHLRGDGDDMHPFFVVPSGGDDALDGGIGDDTLIGDYGADVLSGGDGDDYLRGDYTIHRRVPGPGEPMHQSVPVPFNLTRAQADFLDGGAGNDEMYGDGGDDTLVGGAGNDQLFGDYKREFLVGESWTDEAVLDEAGDDVLEGGDGDDVLNGMRGDDVLAGGAGIDTLLGDVGADTLFGNDGDDFLYGDTAGPEVFTGAHDFLDGGAGNDQLFGESGDDVLAGGDGDDLLIGGNDHDSIFGGDGVDELQGGLGNDVLIGEAGDDLIFGQGDDDELSGDDGNDGLRGDDGDDALDGGAGDDILVGDADGQIGGTGGNDVLIGGAGNDTLVGGGGQDTYRFESGDGFDFIVEGVGEGNRLVFGAGISPTTVIAAVGPNDSLVLRTGNGEEAVQIQNFGVNTVNGPHPIDSFQFSDGTILTFSQLAAGGLAVSGGLGNDQLSGTAQGERVFGGAGNDTVSAGAGNDSLFGGPGNDVLFGESGQDTYVFLPGGGTDTIQDAPGEGNRLVFGSGISQGDLRLGIKQVVIPGGSEEAPPVVISSLVVRVGATGDAVEIEGFDPAEPAFPISIDQFGFADGTVLTYAQLLARGFELMGTAFNDTLSGGEVYRTIRGLVGDDVLTGGMIDNVLDGGDGGDVLFGNGGVDQISGGTGDDVLRGGEGEDTLQGDAGNDSLEGEAGADVLVGGTGDDQLYGGAGSDTYRFNLGDGLDYLYDAGLSNEIDTVVFGNGITASSVALASQFGSIVIRVGAGPDGIQSGSVYDVFGSQTIERFELVDGTVISYADLVARGFEIDGTEFDDFLTGTNVVDRFRGGLGNDRLEGGDGHDAYVFNVGDGTDTIVDAASAGAGNEVVFGPGITSADLRLSLVPDQYDPSLTGLLLHVGTGGDAIQLDTFDRSNVLGPHSVDFFRFADGSMLTYEQLLARGFDIMGTTGDDRLEGTSATDRMSGDDGTDVLRAGAGDDTLDGGSGNDRLIGGQGSDTYLFGPGSGQDVITDTDGSLDRIEMAVGVSPSDVVATRDNYDLVLRLNGGVDQVTVSLHFLAAPFEVECVQFADGTIWDRAVIEDLINPAITGTAGPDSLIGTSDDDRLDGLGGEDQLIGLAGNDRLDGGTGADTLVGGAGNDTYIVDGTGDIVTELANEGIDMVQSSVAYTLAENVEQLSLTGTAALNGTGNESDNVLTGNSAANVLTGGLGNDTYRVGAGDTVVELVGEGTDTVQADVSTTIGANVENLTLTGSASLIGTGNALDNILEADGSVSILAGGDGNDTYLIGPNGDDDILVESATGGIDTVIATHDYRLPDHIENLTVLDPRVPDFASFSLIPYGASEQLVAGYGNELNNMLVGGRANNVLDGWLGADTLIGGKGHDTYIVDHAADVVIEQAGDGTDTVQSSVTYTMSANVENLTITGSASVNGTGNAQNNVVRGNDASNVLDGGAGDDSLQGFGGADTYRFGRGAGRDTVSDSSLAGEIDTVEFDSTVAAHDVEVYRNGYHLELVIAGTIDELTLLSFFDSSGSDQKQVRFVDGTVWSSAELSARALVGTVITGSFDSETILGSDGHDLLIGSAGNDVVVGGRGKDALYGDLTFQPSFGNQIIGDDTLTGGAGDDTLVDFRGTNLFDGGSGNDRMELGTGVDTVLFGRGAGIDFVRFDNNRNDIDVIQLAAGISPGDVAMTWRSASSADLIILSSGERLTIQLSTDWFAVGPETVQAVVRFTDGTQWSLAWSSSNVGIPTATSSDDVLYASSPTTLAGLEGDDTYLFGSSGVGGSYTALEVPDGGLDTVQSLFDYKLDPYVENLILAESTSPVLPNPERGTGNELDNLIVGNTGDNILDGGAGNDVLVGGVFRSAEEFFVFETGRDILIGGAGDDVLMADGGQVVFSADGASGEWLFLDGGSEFREEVPRLADDLLIGGSGNDTYLLHSQQQTVAEYAEEGTDTVRSTVDYVLGDHVENLTLLENVPTYLPGPLVGMGNELDNVLIGNSEDNVLSGGSGHDTLWGGRGLHRDTEIIRSGNDTLVGGVGDDTYLFNSGDGADTIEDLALPGAGNALVFGPGISPISLSLGLGSLVIRVGTGGDEIHVSNFNPNDALGTHAIDAFRFADGTVLSYGQLIARGFELPGTAGNETITGTNVTDRIAGLAGNDLLDGRAGADLLSGGQGHDTYLFNLGDGIDTIGDVATPGEGNRIQFGAGIAQGDLMFSRDEVARTLTIQVGASGTDKLVLTNFDPTGMNGSLVVETLAFVDGSTVNLADLYPPNQAPTVATPIADQTVSEDTPFSIYVSVDTFADPDTGDTLTYTASLADDSPLPVWLSFDPLASTFSGMPVPGAAGTLQLAVTATDSGSLSVSDAFTLTISGPLPKILTGTEGDDVLTGARGDDTLNGLAGNDRLQGGEGHDALDGGLGADTMAGGTGNDTYVVDNLFDLVTETPNEGADTVQSTLPVYTLGANVENLMLIGTGPSVGIGNALNNTVLGNDGANLLFGGNGNDVLQGGAGSDVLEGGAGADTLIGGIGSDVLVGGIGNDLYRFSRGDGQDVIRDKDTTVGNHDRLAFGETINPLDLVIERQVNDLRVRIHHASESVLIGSWYSAGATNHVETIQAGNGEVLLNTQVDQLIQAMAAVTQQSGLTWDQAIDQRPQDVQAVLAASWQ